MDHQSQEKMFLTKNILNAGQSVLIHFDGTSTSVKIPDYLKNNKQVILQFAYELPVPIQNLLVDNKGISGVLSFSGNPFHCFVPWNEIVVISNELGQSKSWTSNVKPITATNNTKTLTNSKKKKELPPYLRVIK